MRKFLDRYYVTLRKINANYVLLNLFNLKKLAHARRLYRKSGIQRSVLLPINSMDLPETPTTELPWLDTPGGVVKVSGHPSLQRFDAATRGAILAWPENGYLVLRGLFKPSEVAVMHCFADDVLCYLELTHRAAMIQDH